MIQQSNPALVLQALWRRAQLGKKTSVQEIAGELRVSANELERILHSLDAAGLADAKRLRLTLQGLATAVALSARTSIASAA